MLILSKRLARTPQEEFVSARAEAGRPTETIRWVVPYTLTISLPASHQYRYREIKTNVPTVYLKATSMRAQL